MIGHMTEYTGHYSYSWISPVTCSYPPHNSQQDQHCVPMHPLPVLSLFLHFHIFTWFLHFTASADYGAAHRDVRPARWSAGD